MSILALPSWIEQHFYGGKKFDDLSHDELHDLQERMKHFRDSDPDVSVVIPAWNEEKNIFRTLSSLASNITKYKVEIVVINNNSTDSTQHILDHIGVRSYFETKQGIAPARQCGLTNARGKYHLCADSDTFYPPTWIDTMVAPMENDKNVTGVYGRYSFIPPEGQNRIGLWFYEQLTGILVQIRKKNREYLNTFGFNMGFVTAIARETGGFNVNKIRVFNNAAGTESFVDESEDGVMAVNLKKKGVLKLVLDKKARVYTSPRRLLYDGGIWAAFMNRFKNQSSGLREYITGKSKTVH